MAEPEAFDQFVMNVSRQTWEVFRRDALLFVIASVVLILVAIAGGLVFLATWDIPAPTTTMEKVVPNDRFTR